MADFHDRNGSFLPPDSQLYDTLAEQLRDGCLCLADDGATLSPRDQGLKFRHAPGPFRMEAVLAASLFLLSLANAVHIALKMAS